MKMTRYIALFSFLSFSAFTLPLHAEVIQAPEQRFTPAPTDSGASPPIFEIGNLNVFKQFKLGFEEEFSIGAKTEIDLLLTTFEFGGAVGADIGAHFGIEVGTCVGGSSNYDLGFAPTVVIPDLYPSEVKIPLTISEGLQANSGFQTNFPSVPTMYADLILDIGAGVKAEACVFKCFTPIDIGFNTCDIVIPDGDGGNLFKESVRCDPFLNTRAYCAVELLSLNRGDNNKLRLLNVAATGIDDFLANPYVIGDFSVSDRTVAGGYGKLSVNAPTVLTNSATSGVNTSQVLRSNGAEDIIGVGIDLVKLFSDFFIPPNYPKVSDSGSIGPIDWNYSLASLTVGPAVQLGMDFEMTWDLVVKDMTFTEPGTTNPKLVRLFTPPGAKFPIGDDPNNPPMQVSKLSDYPGYADYVSGGGAFTLTNCGPTAIPQVFLETEPKMPNGERPPVEVTITYGLKPKLKSVVSMPIIGKLHYDVLKAGASISRVGDIGFGPIIEGDHKFKFGEFEVYNGDPFVIPSMGEGEIKFNLQPAGPPAFKWFPFQWTGEEPNSFLWTGSGSTGVTNWAELVGGSIINYPGQGAGTGSSVMIDAQPVTKLESSLTIDTLAISQGLLDIKQGSDPLVRTQLTVKGLVDNNNFIRLFDKSILNMESTDAVLCGTGQVVLLGGATIRRGGPAVPSSFCNYNLISGAGRVMDNFERNRNQTTTHNAGTIAAEGLGVGANGAMNLTLTLNFDNFPEETSWELKTTGGAVITSGGNYDGNANSTVTQTISIPYGNYVFTISDTFGDGICCGQGNGSYTLHDELGNILASGGEYGAGESTNITVDGGSYLKTGADNFINEGRLSATRGGRLIVESNNFVNRIGSTVRAFTGQFSDTAVIDFRVRAGEHSGKLEATDDGVVMIRPNPYGVDESVVWNAGQSFREDCGSFFAAGGGMIDLSRINMGGGCFFIGENGTLKAERGSFNAGVFEIGGMGVDSAVMEVNGSVIQGFQRSCLNNFGTFRVNGNAEFVNSMLFANHGTIEIPAGGRLHITENLVTAPGAAITSEPGIANVTQDANFGGAILGGIWDIAGEIEIDGADILIMGANATPAATSSGSVNTDGEKVYRNVIFDYYELQLLSVATVGELPATGTAQMIVALVGSNLHVRIYNTEGVLVMDKTESALMAGDFLGELKDLVSLSPLPTVGSLPNSQKQLTIEQAAVISGYDPEMDSDPTAVLSGGNPAEIILRGTSWQWDSLRHLRENRGSLTLVEDADFNPGISANPGASPPVEGTDFTNRGSLTVNNGSSLTPKGDFIQTGVDAMTVLNGNGSVTSATKIYEICGGTVIATQENRLFNAFGGELQSGNKILVKSPITDDDVLNDTLAAEVSIVTPDVISSIEAGAEITLHGASVKFDGLLNNILSNDGKFTISGGGVDNAPRLDFIQVFTNTGELSLVGFETRLTTMDYTQTDSDSVTRIGAGAFLKVLGSFNLNGGELIVEFGSRPNLNIISSALQTNNTNINFNDSLVINFTDELAEDSVTVDVGDSWDILPKGNDGTLTGLEDTDGKSTVTFTLNGDPVPAGWLPPGTELKVERYENGSGLRARVVPENGFYDYEAWVQSEYPILMPYQDNPFSAGSNGVANLTNFFYGTNGGSRGLGFSMEVDRNGQMQRHDNFTFTRPLGTDATYNPYYSFDLVNWRRAAMVRTPGTPPMVNGEIELVTMKAIYPSTEQKVFYRIQAEANPEIFKKGQIPANPINAPDRLENYIAPGETSVVTPGTVLFFNVKAGNELNGDVFGGTTSASDDSRNFIYQDNSRLSLAVLHAGLIGRSRNGLIKVTFIEPQEEFFFSSHPFLNGGGNFTSKASVRRTGTSADTYSFKMELYEEP